MEPVTHIRPQSWMTAPATAAVMQALIGADTGLVALFVGGCVRDALLGRSVGDIDIATALRPDDVAGRLRTANIKVVPTGLAHGTVTAVVDGTPFEITTLRVDIETHGRHATVAFTDNWIADAARRDFTLNALFADPTGAIYDPVGGLADLRAGHIRFVGDAEQRIREDVLRLLRFFRFYAQFGTPPPDRAAMAACAKLADLLPTLSGERVAAELFKLLSAGDPATTMCLMAANGILHHVLPEAVELDRLAALVTVEGVVEHADRLRRMAAGLKAGQADAEAIADRLRLSNVDRTRLSALIADEPRLGLDMGMSAQREVLYQLGASLWRDRVLLAWAETIARGTQQDRHTTEAWRTLYDFPQVWPVPEFPLLGHDVLALGVAPGPAVGDYLTTIEQWWIGGGFVSDREACLVKLREVVAATP